MNNYIKHGCKYSLLVVILIVIFNPIRIQGQHPSFDILFKKLTPPDQGLNHFYIVSIYLCSILSLILIGSLFLYYNILRFRFIYLYFGFVILLLRDIAMNFSSYLLQVAFDFNLHNNEESLKAAAIMIGFQLLYLLLLATFFDMFLSSKSYKFKS